MRNSRTIHPLVAISHDSKTDSMFRSSKTVLWDLEGWPSPLCLALKQGLASDGNKMLDSRGLELSCLYQARWLICLSQDWLAVDLSLVQVLPRSVTQDFCNWRMLRFELWSFLSSMYPSEPKSMLCNFSLSSPSAYSKVSLCTGHARSYHPWRGPLCLQLMVWLDCRQTQQVIRTYQPHTVSMSTSVWSYQFASI